MIDGVNRVRIKNQMKDSEMKVARTHSSYALCNFAEMSF